MALTFLEFAGLGQAASQIGPCAGLDAPGSAELRICGMQQLRIHASSLFRQGMLNQLQLACLFSCHAPSVTIRRRQQMSLFDHDAPWFSTTQGLTRPVCSRKKLLPARVLPTESWRVNTLQVLQTIAVEMNPGQQGEHCDCER